MLFLDVDFCLHLFDRKDWCGKNERIGLRRWQAGFILYRWAILDVTGCYDEQVHIEALGEDYSICRLNYPRRSRLGFVSYFNMDLNSDSGLTFGLAA
jgi:hypothetical protein